MKRTRQRPSPGGRSDAPAGRSRRGRAVAWSLVAATLALACKRDPVGAPSPASAISPSSAAAPSSAPPAPVPSRSTPRAAASDRAAPPTPSLARRPSGARLALGAISSVAFARRGAVLLVAGARGFASLDVPGGAGFVVSEPDVSTHVEATGGRGLALVRAGRTTLWDTAIAAPTHVIDATVEALAWSPDGARVAVATLRDVAVLDAATGVDVLRVPVEGSVFQLAFTADGRALARMSGNVTVSLHDAGTGAALPGGGGADTTGTFGLVLSPDARFAAASAPAGHGLQVFELRAWAPRTLVTLPEGSCAEHVQPYFSDSGRLVFARGGSRWIKAFDAGSWRPSSSYHAPAGLAIASAADDLSRVLVTREDGAEPRVVTASNTAETRLAEPLASDASCAMSPDGLWVACGAGERVRVWSSKGGAVVATWGE